jgi:hypothetical protein
VPVIIARNPVINATFLPGDVAGACKAAQLVDAPFAA